MGELAVYSRVMLTFVRNCLIRELSFRGHFWVNLITRGVWFIAQLLLFDMIYRQVPRISDWTRAEYYAFMATSMIVNSLIEAFFMPNCAQFSEMIRTGSLDFVLLKPLDPQFLVSFERMDLSMLSQVALGLAFLGYSLGEVAQPISLMQVLLYLSLIAAAVSFFYSLMLGLAATSIFFGRNQSLLDFWFYITVFARYPGNIYSGSPLGEVIRWVFSFVLPILLVVTVPARVIAAKLLSPSWAAGLVLLTGCLALVVSRLIFNWSLTHYRSASS